MQTTSSRSRSRSVASQLLQSEARSRQLHEPRCRRRSSLTSDPARSRTSDRSAIERGGRRGTEDFARARYARFYILVRARSRRRGARSTRAFAEIALLVYTLTPPGLHPDLRLFFLVSLFHSFLKIRNSRS